MGSPRPDRLAGGSRRQWTRAAALGVALASAALGPGCGKSERRPSGRVAAATIAPLADLVSKVAGPGWSVVTIVPPGTSPHLFEPAPRDVRRLSGASLVVTVGGGYDGWAGRLAGAASASALLLDAGGSLGIGLESGEARSAGRHGEEGPDPHWWLSPVLASRCLPAIAEALGRLDPAGTDGYRDRAAATALELERLDGELASALAPYRGQSFLAAHPAWPHFAERYGLKQGGSIEPAPGREPSPKELRALVDDARAGRFDVLFTEPQFPESAARTVATDAGLRVALLDPIGGVPGRKTYAEMMRFNGVALSDAFRKAGRQ